MKNNNMYVGMDVDKNYIDVALAEDKRESEALFYGRIENTTEALDKLVKKLKSVGYNLHFVYEAGPCGYNIYRYLHSLSIECTVAAPSLIPKRSGVRIKTNKRDALNLARLHRSGELTSVYVPNEDDEAMRDISRAREDAKHSETKAKQQLLAFLLRLGYKYEGKTTWTNAHRRWIREIKFAHPAQQIVLEEYLMAVEDAEKRVERMEGQIRVFLSQWRLSPVVEAIQSMRGVSIIVAFTFIAELGDLSRFRNARQVMGYLGLVPSEHSTGERRKQGPITKTGNSSARRALVEAAWSYSLKARVSSRIEQRQRNLPKVVKEIAWKAQLRLCSKYRKMVLKGKNKQIVITAIAREMSAFIWAIAREVKLAA